MLRRALVPTITLTLAVVTAAVATPAASYPHKQPAWVSIETPANPNDPSTKNAAFLVHASLRENTPATREVVGTAEGLVGGVRKTLPLRLDTTAQPGVFAVSRQWPAEGTWVLKISLYNTSALVSIDRTGNVAGVTVPTNQLAASNLVVPRPVTAREIDLMLAGAAKQ